MKRLLGRLSVVLLALAMLAFFTASLPAQSQSRGKWTGFSPYEGLSSDSILALLQTDDGYLWVGTGAGVSVRSPAGEWLTVNDSDGLIGNIVTDMAVNPADPRQIWFATDNGVSVLQIGSDPLHKESYQWTSFSRQDGLAGNDVSVVTFAPDGKIWFGTNFVDIDGVEFGKGISVLDTGGTLAQKSDDQWTTYTTANSRLSHNVVRDIAIGPDGAVWITTQAGLNVVSANTWTVYYTTHGLPANDTTRLLFVGNVLWMGSTLGLMALDWNGTPHNRDDDQQAIFRYYNTGLIDDRISALSVDAVGRIWIGTNRMTVDGEWGAGVSVLNFAGTPFTLDDDKWTSFTSYSELVSGSIRALVQSGPSAVWIGTNEGLSHLDYGESPYISYDDQWTTYVPQEGLPSSTVNVTLPFGVNSLWVGSSAGLSLFHHQATPDDKTDDLWDFILSGNIQDLAQDRLGRLWIATTSGLYIWNYSTGAFEGNEFTVYDSSYGLLSDHVNAIALDNQNRGWIATGDYFGGGLQIIDPGPSLSWRGDDFSIAFSPKNSPLPGYATAVQITDGGVWVGTSAGLAFIDDNRTPFEYTDDRWQIYTTANSAQPYKGVQDMVLAADGAVWLAHTIGGVSVRLPGGQWQRFDHRDGLPYDSVTTIIQTLDGRIWMGTDGGGVGVLDYAGTLANKADDTWLTIRGDTLLSGNVRSLAQDNWGQMWVGSFGGGLNLYSEVTFHRLRLPLIFEDAFPYSTPVEFPDGEVPAQPIEGEPIFWATAIPVQTPTP